MEQPVQLIKLRASVTFAGINASSPPRFSYARKSRCERCSFPGPNSSAVMVGIEQAQNLLKSLLAVVIPEQPHLQTVRVIVPALLGELGLGMQGVVVVDKPRKPITIASGAVARADD